MKTITGEIRQHLTDVIQELGYETTDPIVVSRPEVETHGDFATNIAMVLAKRVGKNPFEIAESIAEKLLKKNISIIENVDAVRPGFVNIFLNNRVLTERLADIIDGTVDFKSDDYVGKHIMVEYAHPNTHKEMHIGHMRTLITGESVARIFETVGATVFRANYQGDIGMHVAKAIYGITKTLEEKSVTLDEIDAKSNAEKAHFLGQCYALGSSVYTDHADEINQINTDLYQHTGPYWDMYIRTRQWSLDYYHDFYEQFYTRFDRLFFESEMADDGVAIVRNHIGTVFSEDNGAVIFKGENYGLHTRVFITQKGTPTYEAKDIANAYKQYEVFPYDRNIHVVANEQAGYFQVVFKALELLDAEKFKTSQYHLSMGMVQLKDRKMSSRTGDVFTVDSLIDQVRSRVEQLFAEGKVASDQKADVIEKIVIGAIKYSVLKVGTAQNAAFDIETSVSLDGNSAPYLQYTYARTQSLLAKSELKPSRLSAEEIDFTDEERSVARLLMYYPDVVYQAAHDLQPSYIATYLYDLAQKFNLFYQKNKIIRSETEAFRLTLTKSIGMTLQSGLSLLGIEIVEKM